MSTNLYSGRLVGALLSFLPAVLGFEIFGTIGANYPTPAGGSIANEGPPNSFFQNFTPPYPTNSWWVGYGAGDGLAVCAGPFPYETSLTASAIQFGISTDRSFDGTSIHQYTQTDWSVGFTEHTGLFDDHKALSWDMQTVTLQYFTDSGYLNSYMVPGSPYLTFEFNNATPQFISGQGMISSFAGHDMTAGCNGTATGNEFLVVNDIGTYIIYSLTSNITLTAVVETGGGYITASAPFDGILRVVKLNESSHQDLLDSHAAVWPYGVTVDYEFDDSNATLRFTWDAQGNASDLLMLTWPHHRMVLKSPDYPDTTSLNYLTTKGYMYPILGNVWELEYVLPSITWDAPRSPDSSCIDDIVAGLEYEIGNLPDVSAPDDFYDFGVSAAMYSRLALIADVVGRADLIDPVIEYLEGIYSYWFNSSAPTQAAYETGWGGIIDRNGYNDSNVDYGNGYYNDHHFHYGYFLAAASVICKYDTDWMNEHRDFLNYFLRDIVNPSTNDPYFPVARNRDWFAGHSWASGVANSAGSRDQESTGEAVNGYYGAMLYSNISGNSLLQQYSVLLLATEQHAAQVYWHLYPDAEATARDQPYPEQAVRDLVTMGNIMDYQAGAWLYWGSETVEIAAIQILPVTPVNEYLYDAEWARQVINYTANELSNSSYDDAWKSVIYLAYSEADVQDAANRSTELLDWGTGNSYSNQLYYLSTRAGASGICNSLPANPVGVYMLQDALTGNYVTNLSLPDLYATATSKADAASFNFTFVPNAGNIREISTLEYVTADDSGDYALSAARTVASTWEIFVVRQKAGADDGVYSILAASNKQYIVVVADGMLINNGTTESGSAGFRLISA
ncbi:glycoside hydrolase family 81 protein [Fistulina hepatica ATCC 64428]|nr:glycoside hydrolase family 81 protein [Fistulina hepatica ATCC 64428]